MPQTYDQMREYITYTYNSLLLLFITEKYDFLYTI